MSIFRARTAHDPGALGLSLAAGLLLLIPLALFGNEIRFRPPVSGRRGGRALPAICGADGRASRRAATSLVWYSPRRLDCALYDALAALDAVVGALRGCRQHRARADGGGDVALAVRRPAAARQPWRAGDLRDERSAPGARRGSTIGAANVVFHGASETYWRPWSAWFVSNALTGLAMLPALVAAFAFVVEGRRLPIRAPAHRRGAAVVGGARRDLRGRVPLWRSRFRRDLVLMLYAPLPVLMWAALRFGSAGASLALTAVALLAIWSVDRGTAPFLALSTDDNIITLQVFVLLTTVPVLCLAVVGRARQAVAQLVGRAGVDGGSRRHSRCARDRARGQRLLAAVRRHGLP